MRSTIGLRNRMVNSVGEIVQGNVLLVIASEATQSRCWRRQRARREIASSARLLAMTLNGLLAMTNTMSLRGTSACRSNLVASHAGAASREIASSAHLLAMTLNGLLAMAPLIPQRTACA